MLIYEILVKDHENVKALFERLLNTDEDQVEIRKTLIREIRKELIPHSRAEEAVFYNSLRALPEGRRAAMHGYREHLQAETLMRVLQFRSRVDRDWRSAALKLKQVVEHHIQDEESRIFPIARQLFTESEAAQFGEAFQNLKSQIRKEGPVGTTLDLIRNLVPLGRSSSFLGGRRRPSHRPHKVAEDHIEREEIL